MNWQYYIRPYPDADYGHQHIKCHRVPTECHCGQVAIPDPGTPRCWTCPELFRLEDLYLSRWSPDSGVIEYAWDSEGWTEAHGNEWLEPPEYYQVEIQEVLDWVVRYIALPVLDQDQ